MNFQLGREYASSVQCWVRSFCFVLFFLFFLYIYWKQNFCVLEQNFSLMGLQIIFSCVIHDDLI